MAAAALARCASLRSWVLAGLLAPVCAAAGRAHPRPAEVRTAARPATSTTIRLPLSFEENRGQAPGPGRFLARIPGGRLSLTATTATLTFSSRNRVQRKLATETQRHRESKKGYHRLDAGVGGAQEQLRSTSTSNGASPLQGNSGAAREHSGGPGSATAAVSAVTFQLLGANLRARLAGASPLPGKINYLVGRDRKAWRTGIATFGRVRAAGVYPGIDLVYYGRQDQGRTRLEYDFVVAPDADPERITWAVTGASQATIDARGDLVLSAGGGEFRQLKPVAYQEINGRRTAVPARFELAPTLPLSHFPARIRFKLAAYDKTRPLVIDPVLAYAGFLGSGNADLAAGVAVASDGGIVVAGSEHVAATDTSHAVLMKLNATASEVLWTTVFGGTASVGCDGLALDGDDHPCIIGNTASAGLPAGGGFQSGPAGSADAYVAKFAADGQSLVYCTYYGGQGFDLGEGIAANASGSVFIAGMTQSKDSLQSPDVDEGLKLVNPLQSTNEAQFTPFSAGSNGFIAAFGPSGGCLYSTYFGRSCDTAVSAVTADAAGRAYITGTTLQDPEKEFPATGGHPGAAEAYVARLSAGGGLDFCRYVGGTADDNGHAIAVDAAGAIYVSGVTGSTDFPVLHALQGYAGARDTFVVKLSADASQLLYGTYLGGSLPEDVSRIAVDASGAIYVAGQTRSLDFPAVNFPRMAPSFFDNPGLDIYVVKLEPTGQTPFYSLVIGGSLEEQPRALALDSQGNPWIVGFSNSYNGGGNSQMPTTPNALRQTPDPYDLVLIHVTGGVGEPGIPVLAYAQVASPTDVTLAWDDYATNETAIEVQRKEPGGDWGIEVTLPPNSHFYEDDGLTPDTEYVYRIAVRNAVATVYSNEKRATTFRTVAAPSMLRITALSTARIALAWQNNAPNADHYILERKVGAGEFGTYAGVLDTHYEDFGVQSGTVYTYRVLASSDQSVDSAYSNEVSGDPGTPPPPAPTLTKVAPAVGTQGQQNVSVDLTGTNFVAGATVGFGPGIRVDSASVSATRITAVIDIAADAPLGGRTVFVTNPDEQSAARGNAFTVKALTPGTLELPKKLTYEKQPDGSYRASLVLTNSSKKGTLTGNVDASLVVAPFSVTAGAGAFSLAPKQQHTVSIATMVLTKGLHRGGTIVLTTNDPKATRRDINLSLKVKK
jgi:hypothetical protein